MTDQARGAGHTKGKFISADIVHELNEKHGWFKYGDAQSDVSNAFANEAIARYERIRDSAPDLLENELKNLSTLQWARGRLIELGKSTHEIDTAIEQTVAAIARAKGEA